MIGATHTALTAAVEDELGLPHEASRYATLPDDVADVVCGVLGASVLGHTAAGLCHFCVPTSGGLHRGYSWRMDGSVYSWLRNIDVRLGDVRYDPTHWECAVGSGAAMRHPLAVLLGTLRGKAPLEPDAITFPSAGAMAAWLWSLPRTAATVGAVCHLVQDACVRHHAAGWLLSGHAEYEVSLHALFTTLPRPLVCGAVTATGEARDEVERCVDDVQHARADEALRRAAVATARILAWSR